MSSGTDKRLTEGQKIKDRWEVAERIGGDGFGEIYAVRDLHNGNERHGLKIESTGATKQVLKMEVAVLKKLQGRDHACQFFACGRNDRFNYIIMTLLGDNIADKRRRTAKGYFTVGTALRLGLQMLRGIQAVHEIGFLHRDVKPSNFALGATPATERTVYIIDFGLARHYRTFTGEMRPARPQAGFRGTVRYASITAHLSQEMGRHDDLWSFLYMMIELLTGNLPWKKLKDKEQVGVMKKDAKLSELLEGAPSQLLEVGSHIASLSYADEPDYVRIADCMEAALRESDISQDDPYDWEQLETSNTSLSGATPVGQTRQTVAILGGPCTLAQNLTDLPQDQPSDMRSLPGRRSRNSQRSEKPRIQMLKAGYQGLGEGLRVCHFLPVVLTYNELLVSRKTG